ncbi:hypothetical protein [Nonomuraea soli]|uniref:DUF4352 domain-containing protein n=1 Tax=Nonomuraea soli TaxID=1032476 RepID=A0A7W0CFV3_9ACTN|nr:hypothetical protein [Nonomuraea soli]MBA2890222.1 hypothetical protein [Nonomuraea soli]
MFTRVAAVAAAVTLGVGTAPAQAATGPGTMATPRLTINESAGQCRLTVITSVGMSQAQAQYQIDNGASARIEVWADDLVYDNRLFKALPAAMTASRYDGGLIITGQPSVPCYRLDEDGPENFDTEGDEIYVKVVFDGPGYQRMSKSSNVVKGRW